MKWRLHPTTMSLLKAARVRASSMWAHDTKAALIRAIEAWYGEDCPNLDDYPTIDPVHIELRGMLVHHEFLENPTGPGECPECAGQRPRHIGDCTLDALIRKTQPPDQVVQIGLPDTSAVTVKFVYEEQKQTCPRCEGVTEWLDDHDVTDWDGVATGETYEGPCLKCNGNGAVTVQVKVGEVTS